MHIVNADDGSLEIADIVDLRVLQRLQDTFAKAMGVAAVTVDIAGRPVTDASNFQPLCTLIRSTRVGLARCQECDARGGLAAYSSGQPATYMCMGGMMDAAAPITIEGRYLGCILCGQVVLSEEEDRFRAGLLERNAPLGLPRRQLIEAVGQVPALPRERLDAAVEMLMITANHIVEMGMANLVQSRLLREAQEKAVIQAALRDAQLRALEAQINPHFLFNALALLGYTALEEGAPRTEEITYALSDLLRYSLRNIDTLVPLGDEFEMVERYLAIQQIRFGERLIPRIELDPDLAQFPVPCMLLLPLVENAVVHAVEPMLRPVTVMARAARAADELVIEVCDDGAGMDEAQVVALNSRQVPHRAERKRPSLGMLSVLRRLDGEYGERFGFHVESAPHAGTLMRICLPTAGVGDLAPGPGLALAR
ncbi:MAG TPA: PocR ligand-binding domain-containing protein [Chloroflexaceae bacterium]|nr:PocR ligand-binding domain-containing protein [Chloroflexaceae bacterium]